MSFKLKNNITCQLYNDIKGCIYLLTGKGPIDYVFKRQIKMNFIDIIALKLTQMIMEL